MYYFSHFCPSCNYIFKGNFNNLQLWLFEEWKHQGLIFVEDDGFLGHHTAPASAIPWIKTTHQYFEWDHEVILVCEYSGLGAINKIQTVPHVWPSQHVALILCYGDFHPALAYWNKLSPLPDAALKDFLCPFQYLHISEKIILIL